MRYQYALILVTFILYTGCAVYPHKQLAIESSTIESLNKTEISISMKSILGNFSSNNVDVIENTPNLSKDALELFEKCGFKISTKSIADYTIEYTLYGKSSNYTPKKDFPLNYTLRYGWAMISVMSLNIIPFYNRIEQKIVFNVINNKTNQNLIYESEDNYEVWYSLFLLPFSELTLPGKIISKNNKNIQIAILNKIKKDIDENKL